MRILDININNFRGIEHFYHQFSESDNVICIIGRNDSGKTSILKAIEWLFYPSNSLSASVSDFYNSDTTKDIIIEATFTDFPEDFILPDKYGRYLTEPGLKKQPEPPLPPRYLGKTKIINTSDVLIGGRNKKEIDTYREPVNPNRFCLRARLTISETLEPEWAIVSDAQEPSFFRMADRRILSVSSVGLECRKDLSWGQSSILRKYYKGDNLRSDLKHLSTKALQYVSIDDDSISESFNSSLEELPSLFNKFGLELLGKLSNHLDLRNTDSSISLYEGDISLSSRGLGSQRLASIALNLEIKEERALVLIDEIETSLEPFRIRNLILQLRNRARENGQVIFTTHAPIAVDSCLPKELFIMQNVLAKKELYSVGEICKDDSLEKIFRRNIRCLLARRIIVCEGNTEVEFVKSLESFYLYDDNKNLACYGIEYINAQGGDNAPQVALMLNQLGYSVCVLMDSDKQTALDKMKEVQSKASAISFIIMEDGNCIEQQIINDAPEVFLRSLPTYFADLNLDSSSISCLQTLCSTSGLNRFEIGKKAKEKNGLFKAFGNGEILFPILFEQFEGSEESMKTHFYSVITKLKEWVKDDSALY